jgi:hypothetical protein
MVANLHQVVLLLVAGMMPEAADESDDEDIADALRQAQAQMLEALGKKFPHALFYSHYYRWGLLMQVGREGSRRLHRLPADCTNCWGGFARCVGLKSATLSSFPAADGIVDLKVQRKDMRAGAPLKVAVSG